MESKSKKKINQELPPGATPLTPEDLEGLLPKYITTRAELNDAEFRNISEAAKKYFLSRKTFQLTIGNLYKIHKEMFGHVWKWAGKKRITEKNIGVEKTQIDVELKKLLDDLEYWLKKNTDLIEISARLHHRLVYIHPFNNGNGRWGRFIVNLFLKDHLDSYLDFPEDELLLTTKIRKSYIAALREADSLSYTPLIDLHNKYISNYSL
ncbi:MAG TPA: mobile mystery protein B [Candidatus Heimdallarchaeota archaeon]|nr:mobile mystery protein B [Candidatus Heimdallarchaeota archaeon]